MGSDTSAYIFHRFEAAKQTLHAQKYSVGQTTLEQIFNQFAASQDNPEEANAAATSAAVTTSLFHSLERGSEGGRGRVESIEAADRSCEAARERGE